MSQSAKCVLVGADQRAEIVFATAHHRALDLQVLVATEQQRSFFSDVLLNAPHRNVVFLTFEEYLAAPAATNSMAVILDVPTAFQQLQSLVSKAVGESSQILLVLLKINKKYLKMVQKKCGLHFQTVEFSSNKLVGINDKLRELVDSNYDLNRAGFYAYGSYINYFNANLLKKIFRTDQIDVAKLARSFGFATPPRVKEGKFLTAKARGEKKQQKLKAKIERAEKAKEEPLQPLDATKPAPKVAKQAEMQLAKLKKQAKKPNPTPSKKPQPTATTPKNEGMYGPSKSILTPVAAVPKSSKKIKKTKKFAPSA